jgi:hypothetical protein
VVGWLTWVAIAGAAEVPEASDPAGNPRALVAKSAAILVDLSPIEKVRARVRFEGAAAVLVLGTAGSQALLADIERTMRADRKDPAKSRQETVRRAESVRFELEVSFDRSVSGVRVEVPAVEWGELAGWDQRPADEGVCQAARSLMESAFVMWGALHLSGTAFALGHPILGAAEVPAGIEVAVAEPSGRVVYLLDKATFLPVSFRTSATLVRLGYTPIGGRQALSHLDFIKLDGGRVLWQVDLGFAAGSVVPVPTTVVNNLAPETITAHIDAIRIEDSVAPFLASGASSPVP